MTGVTERGCLGLSESDIASKGFMRGVAGNVAGGEGIGHCNLHRDDVTAAARLCHRPGLRDSAAYGIDRQHASALCCANPLGWVWKAGRGQKGPARNLVSATTSAMETRPGLWNGRSARLISQG